MAQIFCVGEGSGPFSFFPFHSGVPPPGGVLQGGSVSYRVRFRRGRHPVGRCCGMIKARAKTTPRARAAKARGSRSRVNLMV